MDIVHVCSEIGIVTDRMLPVAALPYSALGFPDEGLPRGLCWWLGLRETAFDEL